MKKGLIVFFLSVVTLFVLSFTTVLKVSAAEATLAGKVVFHYQLWNKDYSSSGLWTWNTGTGGTQAPVTSTVQDDFGGVYTIDIMSDAGDTIGLIPLRKDITNDNRWASREVPDGYHINFDVTKIKDGTFSELHVYYFQGGYQTYYVADSSKVNVIVLYYDPTGAYETNLGVHAWSGWTNITEPAWGTPAKVFSDGFKSPGGVQGKAALMQFEKGSNPGMLIYAGTDASKKHAGHGDLNGFDTLENGDVKVVYVSGGTVYTGVEQMQSFVDNAFSFGFIGFNPDGLTGTFAKSPQVIFAKLSIAIATKEVTGKETITVSEVIGKKAVVEESEDGWKLPTDLPTYPTYAPTSIPANVVGKVVFHYQRWGGDYTGTGLWTWGNGTDGSSNAVVMNGVDSFGAVMEIYVDDNADNTIGIIPLAKDIDNDNRWASRETVDGQQINLDVTSIKNGTVTELHVYYFQGGLQEYFVVDPSVMNVLLVYHEPTGEYDANIGLYSWGFNETAGSDWGTLYKGFKNAMKSPAGVQGKVALMTAPATADPGMILCDGPEGKDKVYDGDIKGFSGAGVNVRYVTLGQLYTSRTDFAPVAFGGKVVFVDVYGDVEYEIDVFSPIDISPFFVLKQGTTIIPIKQIDYNKTADSANEFVIQLEPANKLDATKEYTLYFDNGKTGDANLSDNLVLDLDNEKPVIALVEDTRIEVLVGTKWDQALWPVYRVTDTRDGSISIAKVYVKSEHGKLDTNTAGEYPITLQVEDEWGNVGELTFTIYVLPIEKGCGAKNNATIMSLGLLGLVFFFRRRRMA